MSPEYTNPASKIDAWRIGKLVIVSIRFVKVTINSYYGSQTLCTMPKGWRPASSVTAPMTTQDTPINIFFTVKEDGSVVAETSSGGDVANGKTAAGTVMYVCA